MDTITVPHDRRTHLRLPRAGRAARAAGWAAGAVLLGLGLGLASSKLPAGMSAGLLAAIPGLALVARRPELALLLMVSITTGIIDSDRLPLLSLGPVSLHLTDLMLGLLIGLVLRPLLMGRQRAEGGTPLDFPLLWFVAAAVFSGAMAVLLFGVDRTFVLRLLRPLGYYLAFFAVTRLLGRVQAATLLNGLIWLGVLAAVAVLLQTVFPQLSLLRSSSVELVTAAREYSGVQRVYTQSDRLIYPTLMISLAFLALRVTPSWMEAGRLLMLTVGLMMSFQRNYWATALLMVGLLVVLVPGWARRRLALGLGVAALLALGSALLPTPEVSRYRQAVVERLVYGLSPAALAEDGSTHDRLLETEYGLQSLAEHPVLGIGLGNLYRPLNENDLANTEMPPGIGLRWYLHNAYLWVAVDMGLVGLIPFVWLFAAGVLRGLRGWRRMPDARAGAVVLGITLGLLGQAISNVVAPNFTQSWSLVVFVILLGLNEVVLRSHSSLGGPSPMPARQLH